MRWLLPSGWTAFLIVCCVGLAFLAALIAATPLHEQHSDYHNRKGTRSE